MSVDCFQSLVSKFHDECNSSSGQLTFGLMSAGFARLPIHSMVDLICMLTVVVLKSAEQGLNLRSCGWISSVDHS